jgi:hypothetical protein
MTLYNGEGPKSGRMASLGYPVIADLIEQNE